MTYNMAIRENGARIVEIDYLRGFGILAVVAIHVIYDFVNKKIFSVVLLLNIFLDTFITFAVPLFIFISGFVLFLKYKNNHYKISEFYRKRALAVFFPYIFFSIAYTFFAYKNVSLTLIMKNICLARAYQHLWFFLILIQLYILYPYLSRLYDFTRRKKQSVALIIICLITQIIWNVFTGYVLPYLNCENLAARILLKVLRQHICISYIFYFFFGIYIMDNYKGFKAYMEKVKISRLFIVSAMLTIIACPFFLIALKNADYFINIPRYYGAVSLFIIPILNIASFALFFRYSYNLLRVNNLISYGISEIGKYSFGIYLIHMLFLDTLSKIMKHTDIFNNYWIFEAILFTGVVTLSYLSVCLISRLPYSRYLVGR